MKSLRPALLALALSALTSAPAQAATIGLIGGDFDPNFPQISNPGFFELGPCFQDDNGDDGEVEDALASGTFECAVYLLTEFSYISSIDFQLTDGEGLISFGDERIDTFAHAFSQLGVLTESPLAPGAFTLSAGEGGGITCGGVSSTGCDFLEFFSDDPTIIHSVSVIAVNRVPEPATLLLMGPAAILFVRRRVRNRRKDDAV